MNEFVAVFNEYGWGGLFLAVLCAGFIIYLLNGIISDIAYVITEFIKE